MKYLAVLLPILLTLPTVLANEVTVSVNVVPPAPAPTMLGIAKELIVLVVLAGLLLLFLKDLFDMRSPKEFIYYIIALVIISIVAMSLLGVITSA